MSPDQLAAIVAVLLTSLTTLVGLWFRLASRVRHEQMRRRSLADLAEVMRHGGEIVEHSPDGGRLKLVVSRVPKDSTGHGR